MTSTATKGRKHKERKLNEMISQTRQNKNGTEGKQRKDGKEDEEGEEEGEVCGGGEDELRRGRLGCWSLSWGPRVNEIKVFARFPAARKPELYFGGVCFCPQGKDQ